MSQPAQVQVVAGVLVAREGKVLLVQEKQTKVYGQWNLPGGHVDQGETIEQAAIREAKEETGFDVALDAKLLVLHSAVDRPVLHAFAAHITGGQLHYPADEILAAKWFTPAEIRLMTRELRSADYVLGALEAAHVA